MLAPSLSTGPEPQRLQCPEEAVEIRPVVEHVGRDANAEEATEGLRETGVELDLQRVDEPTGIALITVDAEGETTIDRIYHLDRGYERLEEKLAAWMKILQSGL